MRPLILLPRDTSVQLRGRGAFVQNPGFEVYNRRLSSKIPGVEPCISESH
jgi:hypothetical protein